jgi:putative SOS response-associated peptidase YedK
MLEDDGVPITDAPNDESSEAPYQSYNFAPGSRGVVCRADADGSSVELQHKCSHTPENESLRRGAVGSKDGDAIAVKYKLQSMEWGIVPSWSKQDLARTRKAINCRDDSLMTPGGMWQSMKARKRCIVVAQGFFEWLNVSGKEKHPYFIKRRDGRLMCFAGLWDSIHNEGMTLHM